MATALRSSSSYFTPARHDPVKFRHGFERLVEAGLLPHILANCEPGDLFRLARSCRLFQGAISSASARHAKECLSEHFQDVPTFLFLMKLFDIALTGEAILCVLHGRNSDAPKGLQVVVDDVHLKPLLQYLQQQEGYEAGPQEAEVFCINDVAQPSRLSFPSGWPAAKNYQGRALCHADGSELNIYCPEYPATSTVQSRRTSPFRVHWLLQHQWTTATIVSLTFDRITVYHPDLTFANEYSILAPPEALAEAGADADADGRLKAIVTFLKGTFGMKESSKPLPKLVYGKAGDTGNRLASIPLK